MIPNETKLLSLLSNNDLTFFIPPYQRNYEWTEEQCDIFLKDIIKTFEANKNNKHVEHFIGTITYFAEKEQALGQSQQYVLIDGQQRITTTMLFLIAVRDVIDKENIKLYIDKKYLCNEYATGDGEYKIKLKQIEADWECYRKLIYNVELSDLEKKSAVYLNYKYFYNHLIDLKDKNVQIEGLINAGLGLFSIVTLQLEPREKSWENPQEIFESMNSLGKPLSLADLVRNYIMLGLTPKKQDEFYKKYWLEIERTLPKEISNFIRDYMQAYDMKSYMKATEANYKKLYYEFKMLFGNSVDGSKVEVEELLKDLCSKASIYSSIILGVPTGNEEVDRILADFRLIKVSTAYSFILVLLSKWKQGLFNNSEIVDILEALRVFCYRRRILGITSAENKNFPALTGKITRLESEADKKAEMFRVLANQESNSRLPNDIEIRKYLESFNFYNFNYCKLYLALIEENITKSRPNLTEKVLQIEHIMPQTLNDEWRETLGANADEIHTEYVNNIGNLTLIRHNQELGQKQFDEKKELYATKAGLQIANTKITDCLTWNEETILKRRDWLIDTLLNEVLTIPDSMRRTNNFTVKERHRFSFSDIGLIGKEIKFIGDDSIIATVTSNKTVMFEGKQWKLSPLTREIFTRQGNVNASGAYQGACYWTYNGVRLSDIDKEQE